MEPELIPELSPRLAQKQMPQLIQNMKILQMTMQELSDYIEEQVQENPVLETSEEEELPNAQQYFKWMESMDTRLLQNEPGSGDDLPDPDNRFGAAKDGETLFQHLIAQITALNVSQQEKSELCELAAALDDNGYLDEKPAEILSYLGVSEERAEQDFELLRSLNPAGVGARSLGDCLTLQLKRMEPRNLLAEAIASGYLEDMAQSHLRKIAQMENATPEQVYDACELIRTLDPRPGAKFSVLDDPCFIFPDIIIKQTENGNEISINYTYLPKLRISSYYRSLATDVDDAETREYLNTKLRQARWVIGGIERRWSMLMSCAEIILQRHQQFFSSPHGQLAILTQKELAQLLNVSISTVSRAIRGKYLQCARGVFPLNYFFCRSVIRTDDESISAYRAKQTLKALIAGEDSKAPLSDQKLSEILQAAGINLSRRTIAKYREELHIPNTAGRRALSSGSHKNTPTDGKAKE